MPVFSDIIDNVNSKVKAADFYEFSVLSYNKGLLVLAGSEDCLYYHNFEIHFHDVFTVIGNLNWRANTEVSCMEILDGPEAVEINQKFFVEAGNTIFKFFCEDNVQFYIIAEAVSLVDKVVKYYE